MNTKEQTPPALLPLSNLRLAPPTGRTRQEPVCQGEMQVSVPTQHHKAKHEKVGLELNHWHGALFSEDIFMGGYLPERHKEPQNVVWTLL